MTSLEKGLDPYFIVRPCLILAALVLYNPLVDYVINTPTKLFAEAVQSTIVKASGLDITNFQIAFQKSMGATDEKIYDVLQVNPFLELVHLIIYFIGSAIASYMLIRQSVTIAIYYLLGYLSIAFSLIPGNEKSPTNWALTYISILLWEPIIYMIKYLAILSKVDSTSFSSFFAIVAIQLSVIFLIFKVPKFCEYLVNSGSPLGATFSGSPIQHAKKITSSIQKLGRAVTPKK